jgi:uncharacterized protein (TIRG00374 family)
MSEQGRGTDEVPQSMDENKPRRRRAVPWWLTFTLRWGIAVVGIWWVISQITWRDRVLMLDAETNRPVPKRLANMPPVDAPRFKIHKTNEIVDRSQLLHKRDENKVTLRLPGGELRKVDLLALDLSDDLKKVERLLVLPAPGEKEKGLWVQPSEVVGYKLKVPHPLVEVGVGRMIRAAASGSKPWLLVLAILIFPITYIVTSIRWWWLLRVLEIYITLSRAFVLNMVGAFYNTFLLGSTGGDVIKAYFASKQTIHRTRAVMSVIIDRMIGLYALVIMGGTMAAYQYFSLPLGDPARHALGRIALMSGLLVFGTILGLFVFYKPTLRRITGLDWLIVRLPKQKQVQNVMKSMELYRRHKPVVIGALVGSIPVHITVVVSAMLACKAFGLTIPGLYYFVAVPVIVLVGSIPISPQGAGVMEYFAFLLVSRYGGTVSQALALTMSIRMVQILWNLTGGIFVFRGGYHQPSEAEAAEMERDEGGGSRPGAGSGPGAGPSSGTGPSSGSGPQNGEARHSPHPRASGTEPQSLGRVPY